MLAESLKRVLNAVSMASEGCVMLSGPGGVTRKANGIVPGREDSSHQKLSKPARG